MKVYKAINAVQAELAKVGIGKDRVNEQQRYKFRGIDEVYNALSPLLARHGLCILPRCTSRECVERINKKDTALFYVTVCCEFDFVCSEDGSKHTVVMYGEAMDSGDKATNKAMSAAYKYACMQAFSIPTEGDNDADAHTHEVKPATHSAPRMAFESLQPEVQDHLRKAAPQIVAAVDNGEPAGAVELIEMLADNWPNDDLIKPAIWSLLDSRTRSAIKAHQAK